MKVACLPVLIAALAIGGLLRAAEPEPPKPKAVLTDDLSSDEAWSPAHGQWQIKEGKLVQTTLDGNCRTFYDDAELTDHYLLEVDAKKLDGAEGFLIIFHYQGKNVWWNIGGWGNTYSCVEDEEIPGTRTGLTVEKGKRYHFKVVVNRTVLECWVDGKREFRVDVPPEKVVNRTDGMLGLGSWRTAVEYDNFKLTVFPGTPPPPPKPLGEVLAEERPRDWLYEEVTAMAATADAFYRQVRPRLPAPPVPNPPTLDGKLDDPAWASATCWRVWVPWQQSWAKRNWASDLPVARLSILCCRHGGDLYIGARWRAELGDPPLEVRLDEGKSGRGEAEWCLRGKQSATFDLVGRPPGAINDVACRVEVAASPLAVWCEGAQDDYPGRNHRLVLRGAEPVGEAGVLLPVGSQARKLALQASEIRDAVYQARPAEGLSILKAEVRLGKTVFRLPSVRYLEPVSKITSEADIILQRNEAPPAALVQRVAALRARAGLTGAKESPSRDRPLPPVPGDWRSIYRDARALKSECLLARAAKLPPVAVFTRHPMGRPFGIGTYICWNIVQRWGCDIRVFDPKNTTDLARRLFGDRRGVIFDMNVAYDAKTLFFSFKQRRNDSYHLYEIGADGDRLEQLTDGPYHDVHPLLLPEGKLLFVSTRRASYSMCQPGAASCMFLMDRDGSNIRPVSVNTLGDHSPQMLPDGRVLFTRWEYVDKGLFLRQGLWTVNPDGTRLQVFFGNTIADPNTIWQARPIPGRPAVVATFAPHHGSPHGAIGIVNNRVGMEAPRGVGYRWVTKEFPTVGDRNYFWAYRDPLPVDRCHFLVSYGGSDARRFRIFLLDDRDNKECIYSDPEISVYNPLMLASQPPPPVPSPHEPCDPFPGLARGEEKVRTGTFLLIDVYRGLPETMRGKVKAIQIMEQVPKPCNMRGLRSWDMDPLMSRGTYYAKRIWGTVPVEEDGSAYFVAPSDTEIYFQALDASGKELQRMGSATQIMPGEFQSCIGCHEPRQEAPPNRFPKAAQRPPSVPRPPHWGNDGLVDFVRVVQPVLDKYCVRCHSGPTPVKGLDLSDDKTRYFNMAYNHMVDGHLVHYLWLNRAHHNVFKPGETGTQASRLLPYLDSDPCGHGQVIPLPDRQRVYNWIDSNVAYYGTYEHARPGVSGCRDLWDGPWYTKQFAPVYQRRCGGCHAKSLAYRAPPVDPQKPSPDHRWINLTHPEWSRVLTAPLAKGAGGLGLCRPEGAEPPPVFADKTDPDYAALLEAIEQGRQAMLANPRVDMPEAKPKPYYREFDRVFSGFGGP